MRETKEILKSLFLQDNLSDITNSTDNKDILNEELLDYLKIYASPQEQLALVNEMSEEEFLEIFANTEDLQYHQLQNWLLKKYSHIVNQIVSKLEAQANSVEIPDSTFQSIESKITKHW